ncbi:MAG: 50S ribosomal protein L10 [Euryarchaeota archaeon]|nr:50S ribosomal protein L10 [Euryarchaeota archaeon]
MAKRQAHVAPAKKEQLQRLNQLIRDHKIIAIAKVAGIPGPQLQKIRGMLRGKAEIVVSKNNLFRLALLEMEKGKPGLKGLAGAIQSQTALVATDLNPFLLFKQMEATKMPSPAKGGELAPDDIKVSEGETSFKPGPIVGELQKAGIPAGIEGGKVLIKKDKTLVRKGDRIPRELAPMLAKLEIHPLVVGLDLQAAWEAGTVYPANLLAIDEVKIMGEMGLAAAQAFKLAMLSAYPTPFTIRPLIAKARMEAMGLALEAGIPTKDTIELLIGRAGAQARALSSAAGV